jgi:outer membrane protein assembly factor BamB
MLGTTVQPATACNFYSLPLNRLLRWNPMTLSHKTPRVLLAACLALGSAAAFAKDQPQWGQAWSRNMVSSERGLPETFDPKTGLNIKWTAAIGTESHSTPIVAGGRVYIGTNNGKPRDPKHEGDRGVFMCFDEKTGALLWQLVVPKREDDQYYDWPNSGMSSPATVEGDRVYLVNSRGEVMCLDAKGLANGNQGPFLDEGKHMALRGAPTMEPGPLDADVLWSFDLTAGAGIYSHDGAHSSVLIHGNYLYLNSGTGVDNTHRKIRTPDAPSLVVLDKRTGQLVARDDEKIAPNIFHCTWSSPALAEVNGKPLIVFAGGNGIVYAFEPIKKTQSDLQVLKKAWQFDIDPAGPKTEVHRYTSNKREGPSNIYGMPVFYDNKIYIAGGGDIFWGKNEAWLKCIDATKTGDITKSGEVWSYTLDKHVMSTAAIYNGLLFIADIGRKLYCLDAATGRFHWAHEMKGDPWSSPLVADGKVYIGTRKGDFWVLKASTEKQVLGSVDFGSPISATATAANGTLYVATMKNLYAIQSQRK